VAIAKAKIKMLHNHIWVLLSHTMAFSSGSFIV